LHTKNKSKEITMAVPAYQYYHRHILEIAADGKEHNLKDDRNVIAEKLNLKEEDLKLLLSSGQTVFYNRTAWAKSCLIHAKAIEATGPGIYKITQRGIELLKQNHKIITATVLSQYPEFEQFRTPKSKTDKTETAKEEITEEIIEETPEESLEKAYQDIRNSLANEILEKIKKNSPKFFENLVVDLMVAMGYGGSKLDAGKSIGKTGDEGIDGIIKEDKLGLDVIYLQAKRWEGTVGRPEIQRFVGALHGKRAKKGVFITTGCFSSEATEYVATIDPKVILIDGVSLVEFMMDHNLGTNALTTYQIKRIDSDYFTEE